MVVWICILRASTQSHTGYSEIQNNYLNVSDEAKLMNIFKLCRFRPIHKSVILVSVHNLKKGFEGHIIYNMDQETKTT